MLIFDQTGEEVKIGAIVSTFRGEIVTVKRITKPHKPGSTGRVSLLFEGGFQSDYFPSVIDASWKEEL